MFDSASADENFCYLVTTGRVTARPHEIEIWFAADGDTLYLLAGAGTLSGWRESALPVAVDLRDQGAQS
jgi:hypothetical protein